MHRNCDPKLSSHLKLYKRLLRISSIGSASSCSFVPISYSRLLLFLLGIGPIIIRLGNAGRQPPMLEEARGSQIRELEAEPGPEGVRVGEWPHVEY